MDEQDPIAISGKAFQIVFGITLFIAVIAFTPISGWLGNASADWVASVGTYIKANPQSQSLDEALVGHWTFDGPEMNWSDATTEVKDRSSEANHGNVVGFGPESAVQGVLGQGLGFDGLDDYVSIPNSGSFNTIYGSISLWYKSDGFWGTDGLASGDTALILARNDSMQSRNGFSILAQKDGTVGFQNKTTGAVVAQAESSVSNLHNNTWQHITYVFSRLSGENSYLYVNGELSATEVNDSNWSFNNQPVRIADNQDSFWEEFKANIDDVRWYNRSLTLEEVQSIYNEGLPNFFNTSQTASAEVEEEGLLSLFTFDGGNINWGDGGSEIKDASGQGNDVNATGGIDQGSTAIGQLGQGLAFDGVSDSLTIPHTPDLKPETITISSWVKRTGVGPQKIVSNTQSGGVALAINLDFQDCASTNNICFLVNVGGTYYSAETDLTNVPTGGWAQVTGTYDGETVRLYVNGILADSNTSPSGNITYTVNTPMCIGSEPDATVCGTGDFFAGTLDDVRIYDRALPPERIASLYSRGTGSTVSLPPPCGSLMVNDSEGNTYPTIQIGTQCWMAENMRAGTRISTGINQTDNSTVDRWCYSNNDDFCDVNNNPNNPDGGLYQWAEAMQYSTTEGAQGICPTGWHIPSDNDWKILEIALGMTQIQADAGGNRGTDQGTQLKANGSSGFEANLAGGSLNGIAFSRGSNGNYWSSTAFGGANAWSRNFSSSQSTVNRLGNPRNAGLSVRCVKG